MTEAAESDPMARPPVPRSGADTHRADQGALPGLALALVAFLSVLALSVLGLLLAPMVERAAHDLMSARRTASEAPGSIQPRGKLPPPAQRARLRSDLSDVFTEADYPALAKLDGIEGRVAIRLTVDAVGRAARCEVVNGSGSAELDRTTCRLAVEKIQFEPARDAAGRPVASEFPIAVRWQLS